MKRHFAVHIPLNRGHLSTPAALATVLWSSCVPDRLKKCQTLGVSLKNTTFQIHEFLASCALSDGYLKASWILAFYKSSFQSPTFEASTLSSSEGTSAASNKRILGKKRRKSNIKYGGNWKKKQKQVWWFWGGKFRVSCSFQFICCFRVAGTHLLLKKSFLHARSLETERRFAITCQQQDATGILAGMLTNPAQTLLPNMWLFISGQQKGALKSAKELQSQERLAFHVYCCLC